jgi:hypothetical protein
VQSLNFSPGSGTRRLGSIAKVLALCSIFTLQSCKSGDTEYPEFDQKHENILGPLKKAADTKSFDGRIFDYTYIDKIYPNSVICFTSEYMAETIGGVPDEIAKSRFVIPGPRRFHNGGQAMGIVTSDVIYTFPFRHPHNLSNPSCRKSNGENISFMSMRHRGSYCFKSRGAISTEYIDNSASGERRHNNGLYKDANGKLKTKRYSATLRADCPDWLK